MRKQTRKATLYRMMTNEHICPFGIKAKDLLQRQGFQVEDKLLTNPRQINAFKKKHQLKTTPQAFIDGQCIGGYDDLVSYFKLNTLKQEGATYQPIIAIFITTLIMSIAINFAVSKSFDFVQIVQYFIATSMCVLGIMKLKDLYGFTNQFLGYDLLAQKWVRYAYIYPFVETLSGTIMISGSYMGVAAIGALCIGTIGAISVFKAVYIDKRDLRCACVGGNSQVPLGFISLTENLMMIFMALWIWL